MATFKEWFGKSRLRTKAGDPIVMYHGSHHAFDRIDPSTFGRGNDQYGAGFYLSNTESDARGYGPHVIKVFARIEKPLSRFKPLTARQIQALITSAPDYKESLNDYDDVERLGVWRVLNKVVDLHLKMPAFDAVQAIQNDFYGGRGSSGVRDQWAAKYLKIVHKVTGYDGVIEDMGNGKIWAAIWFPNQAKYIGNTTFSNEDDDMRKNPRKRRRILRNPIVKLSGPQIRAFLLLGQAGSEFTDNRLGAGLQRKGLTQAEFVKYHTKKPGWMGHGVVYHLTPLGTAVRNEIWRQSDKLPPAWDDRIPWGKLTLEITVDTF